MNTEAAKEALKDLIEDELVSRGINTGSSFTCLNPEHEDKSPSMSLNKKGRYVHCFACGATYDTVDIIGLNLGYTDKDGIQPQHFIEALKYGCSKHGIYLDDKIDHETKSKKPTPNQKQQRSQNMSTDKSITDKEKKYAEDIKRAAEQIETKEAIEYLNKRGISIETAKAYNIGYLEAVYFGNKDQGQNNKALIIPNGKYSYMARNIESDDKAIKTTKRGTQKPFNLKAIYEHEHVHIVEGELDALSVIEAGGNAIAIGSAAYTGKLIDELKEVFKNASESRIKPPKVKKVIISLDNDKSGYTASTLLIEDIKRLNALGHILEPIEINISGEYNDPNEAWINKPEEFRKAIKQTIDEQTKRDYLQTSAKSKLPAFYRGVSDSANMPAIPTGYKALDKELEGGLYEGFYVFAALTSLGKTAFVLQMADSIAAAGKDVLYITLEMASNELIARSLSRHTFTIAVKENMITSNAKSVRGITDGKRYTHYNETEQDLIMRAYNEYSQYADKLFIREGLGDITPEEIRKMIKKHKEITGNTPVLIVDYIQILAPTDIRASDKQNMDIAALEMKRISRDYKTPVIVVSSINRKSYKERINFEALKESGALEYTADVIIGMNLEGAGTKETKSETWQQDKMSEDPRKIELDILKNRNGKIGATLKYQYYPIFNYFWEQ